MVYYSYQHPETKQFQRFRKYISMKLLTKTARYASVAKEISRINKWLREGNNPYDQINRRMLLTEAFPVSVNQTITIPFPVHLSF